MRHAFSTHAALRDPELGRWIAREVRFPHSMVDRITTATTDEDRADVARRFGVDDQVLCYVGYLAGYRFIDDVCGDPVFATFLLRFMERESARPCTRYPAWTSDRIPKFLLPIIRHNLATGGEITRSVTMVAAWAHYAEGADDYGAPTPVEDPLRAQLMAAARRPDPLAFLHQRDIFGDLADDPRFTAAYAAALTSLRTRGSAATLRDLT